MLKLFLLDGVIDRRVLTADVDASTWAHHLCDEVVQPDSQTCLPSSQVAQGVLLIPVSGREVGVVCGGEEPNDEKVSGTPRSVL